MQYKIVKRTEENSCNKLIKPENFDATKLAVGVIEERSIPANGLKYYSIPLFYEGEPGKFSNIYLKLPAKRLTFGIQDNTFEKSPSGDQQSNSNWSLPICIHGKGVPPNAEESLFLSVFEQITDFYRKFLLSPQGEEVTGVVCNAQMLENLAAGLRYPLLPLDPNKKGPKAKIRQRDPNNSPILHAKLKVLKSHIDGSLTSETLFYDQTKNKNVTDRCFDLYKTMCKVSAIVELQNIFCGANGLFRVQIKLHEAVMFPHKRIVHSFVQDEPDEEVESMDEEAAGGETSDKSVDDFDALEN